MSKNNDPKDKQRISIGLRDQVSPPHTSQAPVTAQSSQGRTKPDPEKLSHAIAEGLVTAGRGKAELDPKVMRQAHNAAASLPGMVRGGKTGLGKVQPASSPGTSKTSEKERGRT
jgi:hypothetical protein